MLYLDNSATTKVDPEVYDAMLPYLLEEFGNPSSKYYPQAVNSKNAVAEARKNVADLLGVSSKEIIFTSGSTEGNNMIIKGAADYYADKGNHIITTSTEHPSVLETCRYLETKGFEVTYLPVDQFGRVSLDDFKRSFKDSTILATVIWGNNELGSLNNIKELSDYCLEQDIFFHTDATQVIGKVDINLEDFPGISFLSCSAHKFHGPKGVGCVYIKKDQYDMLTPLTPLYHGGGQENNFRSGTLAVPGIIGIGKAAELARERMTDNIKRLEENEDYLTKILKEKFSDVIAFNNDVSNKIPGILNVQFKGINNELLLKQLAPVIAASTGSACSSSKPSHVLQAIGLSLEQIRSTIRFSLSFQIYREELDVFKEL
ncbi:cysteine desulfurase [Planomicrobium koreense]|uniref:Cysteine desulfurase n=1 Tax=Planococcus koreensis TaxID=112331 RepID=A0A7W8CUK6_9BACL|nr:cysteine desulfurase family protein [Planococcus koreensis]MBB5180260.1 cysteine desulfurase [Planococcus koreensis]